MIRTALAVALLAGAAGAAPVTLSDDDVHWQIDLPDGWAPADPGQIEGARPLAAFASGRRHLVVARVRGDTEAAYGGKPGFFSGLEDGVKKEVEGYQRVSGTPRKLGKKKKLPAYDLWYRAAGDTRGARFIFMRNYIIVATIDLPGETTIPRDARRLLESFGPPP